MSGFICPYCKKRVDIFKTGGGEAMAREMKVRFLGSIPLDPQIVESGDAGTPHVHTFAESQTAQAFKESITPVLKLDENSTISSAKKEESHKANETTTIAVAVAGGMVSMHFGHCDEFVLFGVNKDTKQIISTKVLSAPPHEPGVLPKWLHEKGANLIITGGMGSRAQQLFAQHDVKVVIGVKSEEPVTAVQAYLAGTLQTGTNICDH
jgi:predicted Fe-Mo cluster-binding NifX family protein